MRTLACLAAALVFGLTACSGTSSTDTQQPAERLAAAKKSFDAAAYIAITLATNDLPGGINGLESAQGTGTHAPAFDGQVEVKTDFTLTAPIIAVGGKVYAKLPFAGWSELNPGDYGAPDPAALLDTHTGISSLLTKTQKPSVAGSQRSGKEVLTTIKGTLPGAAVHALFPSSGAGDFAVVYTLTDTDELHGIVITGPFYAGQPDVTYTIDVKLHATPVDIKAPAT